MTTFQVTLYLCMLGLCLTAPKTRNVRWCVTSDIEDKKCNDLVHSCSIQEILLICVKRSSTQDCMKAISDGNADAISMDSGDVYKASLNPYNLKPIMIESYGSHKAVSVVDTPCLKERQKLLGGERPRPGAYIPQCDEKGDYKPQQCHGSTGYCWCVNSKGEEIPGTKTPPGQTPPTCGVPVVDTPCLKERQKVLGGGRPLLGAYVPQCDEKGDYTPQQCHGSTGYCWCVSSKGEEIAGTKTPPGQTPPTCGVPVADSPCLKERQKLLGGEQPRPGAYIPQCDEKGDYRPQQCHGSTGYCWCVNAKGEEIPGTKTPPGQTPSTCGVPVVDTPCFKERQKVLGGERPRPGAYIPQCDEKGDYSPQQCHSSTGYCWCVNSKGEEIAGTKTPPGQTPSTCKVSAVSVVDTPCLKERQQKLGELPVVGAYVPQCDEKGDYSPQQCHGSTGYCWCVNAKGEEIAGTKTPPGQTPPTCGVPVVDTPCLKERQKALGGGRPLRGAYVPQCDEKGDYSPQQCHGSTGYCWCVSSKGEEIAGTKTPPGQTPSKCGVPVVDTPCFKERQKLGELPGVGAYVPQCDEKGDYSPQQCHGSTGYCWCVNAKGEEIAGTKTPPGQTPPTCGVPVVDTPCLKERQKALGGGQPLRGAYVPQCDEKGDYSPQQCHGSTGYCWCVNAKGEEIPGTKTPPGQTPSTCGVPVVDTPCLKERQKVLGGERPRPGAYIPQCDEKGDYSPQQCHSSTGYCWCVNSKGEEIAGTKTPPGQTPSTCKVSVVDTPCFKERQKLGELPGVGAYVPQCDEKGDYSPQQCHGSTGYCWCVNAKGEEIAGTKTPPGQTPPTCGVPVVDTPCLKERQKALGGGRPLRGAYVPQCDEKGDYSPQQCHGSTGYCWCVSSKGEEIAGTKTPPGQTPSKCGVPVVDTPCFKERQKLGELPGVGAYVPQCDEKGDYSPQQCHGSTGYCWCVNAKGEEIAGTKTPPGQTPPTCGVPVVDTPCLKERQKALGGGQPLRGAYVPQCDEKGDYSPQQCHGSTGYCWCVNAKGEEIPGTKTPPGQTPSTCGVPVVDTPCLKERQKALRGGQPLRGAYVPQCDEKGDYSPQQCHGSTGYCWCVNAKGEEIAGTKTPPGQTPPTCGVPVVDTPCLKERQKVLGGGRPLRGAYVPQCDEKGDYTPQQCHGSTGYCWCVSSKGEEIAGTKTPPGQTPSKCGVPVADSPCLKERQKLLGGEQPRPGAYIPQCDEKGDYRPQQCHGSTGYCWCVNAKGEEIPGTKTPPGQTPSKCGVPVVDTPCFKERQKLGELPGVGAYVPQCDEKGDYSPQQCHGSTGYCWCVNAKGEEIAGTKTPPGQTPPTCGVPVVDTPCLKERQKALGGGQPLRGAYVPQCDEKGDYSPQQCHGSTGYCWCVNAKGEEIPGTKTPPGQTPSTCGVPVVDTPCLKERQKALGGGRPLLGAYVPQCDEKGDYSPLQHHGSTGYCWCVNAKGEEIPGTKTPPGQTPPTCGVPVADASCLKERQKLLGEEQPRPGAYIPQCDEKGDYIPKQCHGSTGYCWCVNSKGEEIAGTKTPPGQTPPKCAVPVVDTPCLKERQKALGGGRPLRGAYVPQCDEKGDYSPLQHHGSTGYSWCVNAKGEEIAGTKTPPGQTPPTCGVPVADASCLKERQKLLGEEQPRPGAYIPQCDEKGDYIPKQCHGSTGYCWCVNSKGEEIAGTKTPPGQTPPKCAVPVVDTPCLKERQKALGGGRPLLGAYVPQCDEKGDYSPLQHHGSTGYSWCVNAKGEEIAGTKTPPGQTPPTCGVPDSDTCHYAVAVVKKSSRFQFNELKGKRSCHSEIGTMAGWNAPVKVLLKKKLLLWEGPEKESIEKAVSGFFSVSCIPGAIQANLCRQCTGEGNKKCKSSHDEPYYGNDGAFTCLRADKGDVAFVKDTALSGEYVENYELLCPDNTRRPLREYKDCNLGKVPADAVLTRRTGDKTKDINKFLLEAQKKECKLFSSKYGKDLLFEDSATSLIPLPSEMDTFLLLGAEWFNVMKELTVGKTHLTPKNNVRWCTQSRAEKMKCDNWSSVSGGAISCTEASSADKCVEQILKGEADAVTLDVEHMYTALKCGLVPALEEYHNKDDFNPCKTHGSEIKDFGTYSGVALVKKSNKDITWKNLKGKKSCHTDVGHIISWNMPVSLISKQTNNCDIGSFFNQSCAPGSDINSNLCKLCIGDPKNIKANTKCSLSDQEAYYGNAGAFRCLVEKGDVAFLSHTVVYQNTDGKNPAVWAKNLKSNDFELLCLDGSRASVTDYKKCNLANIPPRAIVTRQDSVTDVVRIVNNQQSLYGRKGFEKDMFQMFASPKDQNLLFSDDTQCLIQFDRLLEDILLDYFGKSYNTGIFSPNQCSAKSELLSACTFHHC